MNIIINNEFEFHRLNHDETKSYQFNSIEFDTITFNNINLNLLEISMLKKLRFNSIIFNNCILGNLDYINLNNIEVHIYNQELDFYIIKHLNYITSLYLKNNKLNNLNIIPNKNFETLSIKENNIYGKLITLRKNVRWNILELDNLSKYKQEDIDYLTDIMEKQKSKIDFDGKLYTSDNLYFLQRKIKIKNLIEQNA